MLAGSHVRILQYLPRDTTKTKLFKNIPHKCRKGKCKAVSGSKRFAVKSSHIIHILYVFKFFLHEILSTGF